MQVSARLDSFVDDPGHIEIRGLAPGGSATVTLSVTDAAGHDWRSVTSFVADASGHVDTRHQPPSSGGYGGADPTGPWWSMRFASAGRPTAFTAPADLAEYACVVTSGTEVCELRLTRRWIAPGTTVADLTAEHFRAVRFQRGTAPAPLVVILPGSTGTFAMTPMAALLASHGYRTAVLAYAAEPGLPGSLREIPADRVGDAIRELAAEAEADADKVVVIAVSVGTEVALSALARGGPVVRGVVAIAPSDRIWQALSDRGRPPSTSAVSVAGEPLAWEPVRGERVLLRMITNALLARFFPKRPVAIALAPAYAAGKLAVAADRAIPVELIDAPLLVLSGRDDEMWPASDMGARLLARRASGSWARSDRHVVFPDAGHFLRPPVTPTTVPWNDALVSGGTPNGNARAQAGGWSAILAFLSETLGSPRSERTPFGAVEDAGPGGTAP